MDGLSGVRVIELEARADSRGAFTETFRQAWFPELGPIAQANLSRSKAGVLRGMHFHRLQADYWCFLEGSAFVGLFDLRSGSPTRGRAQTITIDAAGSLQGLFLPPGVAHGFCALTDVTLQYLVDRAFDGADEFGFAWNDPGLPIDWPLMDPVISGRDAAAPSLAEAQVEAPSMG